MSDASTPHTVAVVGAGPAGLYATRKLAQAGVHVLLLNRDLKPGGLAEYGIYYTKHKMKEGLRRQFRKILELPNVYYVGGLQVGNAYDINLEELHALGCSAVLFAIGAQGTKSLKLPGEEHAHGVFHAKDLVYHFNQLPPFASQHFDIGQRVGIIGMGNVMVDVAHWLIRDKKVEEVVVIARRGPGERAYTDKEMRAIIEALDQDALRAELEHIGPALREVGQDPEALFTEMLHPLDKAASLDTPTRLKFQFLSTSRQIVTDDNHRVAGLEVERNKLVPKGERLSPKGTGELDTIPLDTLIYAIGDQVDPSVGLPFKWGQYIVAPTPHPHDPERPRYEVYDPEREEVLQGTFVGGWARVASDGLVGKARADGETAADEVLAYLNTHDAPQASPDALRDRLDTYIASKGLPVFHHEHVQLLEAVEQAKAAELGTDFFKFNSNDEMFNAIKGGETK